MNDFAKRIANLSPKKLALLAIDLKARLDAAQDSAAGQVAIIGLSCRFPGVDDAEQFWDMLRNGKDAVTAVPEDRWDSDAYFDADANAAGKINTRSGGFLRNIDQFDAHFFGISPREAASMDPQHRLLLEVAWEALENAGHAPTSLVGSSTGVFIGISATDYERVIERGGQKLLDVYRMTGVGLNFSAGRLSYILGLNGPSMAVDTACSSSLAAIHLACQSLRSGESRLALAGGVNVILTPENSITTSTAQMLSPDGRCKSFSADADGIGRAEGCGVVVLKRLEDAKADGDRLLAVVRGSALNQDGRSSGLTVPNGLAQQQLIHSALRDAGVVPADVSYVEAHGTGTPLGDPVEANALGEVFRDGRAENRPLIVGSVKTNIGHAESAAGIAGLIKTVLALYHGKIPPHLHASELNPRIDWSSLPLTIPSVLTDWPESDGPCIAGVSSFGGSGTNAHIVLEQVPAPAPAKSDDAVNVLCVSAKGDAALRELVAAYSDALAENSAPSLRDICFTACAGRSHFSDRLAIVASSKAEMVDKLNGFLGGTPMPGVLTGVTGAKHRTKIAFLFSGQGTQYAGMGRDLYETQPVFREALDHCDEKLQGPLGHSLLSVLYPDTGDDATTIDTTANTQPALFAIEYALARLWESWGITPSIAMGHSVGEYVAACIAGVFSLEDGLKLIAERARLMQKLPGDGTMVAVFADEQTVHSLLEPYADQLVIAAVNSPATTVVSGATEILHEFLPAVERAGLSHHTLNVSHAFHSPLVEPMLDEFERFASGISFSAPQIPLVSNITGEAFAPGQVPDANYWRRHVRACVRFQAGMQTLADKGCRVYLEIGPKPSLVGLGQQCIADTHCAWLPSLKNDYPDRQRLYESLAALYSQGAHIDWAALDSHLPRQRVTLPTYPFQRSRFWIEPSPGAVERRTWEDSAATPCRGDDLIYEVSWPLAASVDSVPIALRGPDEIVASVTPSVVRLSAEHDFDSFEPFFPALDALCAGYVIDGLGELGWQPKVGERLSTTTIAENLGVVPKQLRLLERMLEILAEEGVLTRDGSDWRVDRLPDVPDPAARLEQLRTTFPAFATELGLIERCADGLADTLRDRVDPLQLLFPGGDLTEAGQMYQNSPSAKIYNSLVGECVAVALADLPENRTLRVLEIGGGTGGTTAHLLQMLPAGQVSYVFTDISPLFTAKAKEKFSDYDFVEYQTLDITVDPAAQGFGANEFDLIIAANVIHATPDVRKTLANVRALLASDGLLMLLEGTARQRFGDLTVGLTEGWWAFKDHDLRPSYALLSQNQWSSLLADTGFADSSAVPAEDYPGFLSQQAVIVARGPGADKNPTVAAAEPGTWILCSDQLSVGTQLAERLGAHGQYCMLVEPGKAYAYDGDNNFIVDPTSVEDFRQLLDATSAGGGPPIRGVVHLWNLDALSTEDMSATDLEEMESLVCGSLLHLTQALAAIEWKNAVNLTLVTRGAQSLGDAQNTLEIAQAPVWGLSHVIELEHPELNCRRIDLDPAATPAEQVEPLFAEIWRGDLREDQIAFRASDRYVRRLGRVAGGAENTVAFDTDASYLITGGLGGLGLLVARWMIEHGTRSLALIGRSAMDKSTRATLDEFEKLGARILVVQGDVSRHKDVVELFARIGKELPPLKGVMHMAGLVDDGALLNQTWERFGSVMAAKVSGSWNLHCLTRELSLDFFALFSTGVSIFGSRGQGNHAAANAFVDALAHYRQARGLPAVAVNWGAWSGAGAAVDRNLMEERALPSITPEEGLKALARALALDPATGLHRRPQIAVLRANWAVILNHYEPGGEPSVFRNLRGERLATPVAPEAAAASVPDFRERLNELPLSRRRAFLRTEIRRHAATVLGLAPDYPIDADQPLNELGLDSLMAVELRNALGAMIEQSLPATLLYERPTIVALTDFLAGEVLTAEEPMAPVQPVKPAKPIDISNDDLDELSEDEMAELLHRQLRKIEE